MNNDVRYVEYKKMETYERFLDSMIFGENE